MEYTRIRAPCRVDAVPPSGPRRNHVCCRSRPLLLTGRTVSRRCPRDKSRESERRHSVRSPVIPFVSGCSSPTGRSSSVQFGVNDLQLRPVLEPAYNGIQVQSTTRSTRRPDTCESQGSLLRPWLSSHRGLSKDKLTPYLRAFDLRRRIRQKPGKEAEKRNTLTHQQPPSHERSTKRTYLSRWSTEQLWSCPSPTAVYV